MRKSLLIWPILALSAIFLFKDINKPFLGLHENNSIGFSYHAREILNKGLLETKFCGTTGINHPCLLQVLLAGFYKVGGFNEVAGRLLPILSSLGSLFLVYLLGKKFFGETVGLLSMAVMAFLPSFLTFGDMICHEMVLLFFALLGINFFVDWTRKVNDKYFYLAILSLILASLIDWPGFYLWGIFSAFLLFQKKKKYFVILVTLGLLTVMALVLHSLFLIDWNINTFIETYKRLFLNRALAIEGGTSALLNKVFFREKLLFTPEIIVLSFLGLIMAIAKKEQQVIFLLILLLFASLQVLIFRGGWYQHFYWSYYFIPFLSISTGYFLAFLVKKWGKLAVVLVAVIFLFYVRISLRDLAYFDNFYDKNLNEKILETRKIIKDEKIFLITPGYSTIALQFYLPGGFTVLEDQKQTNNPQIKWAISWILPDITQREEELTNSLCHSYGCQTIIGEGNYPLFKLVKLR